MQFSKYSSTWLNILCDFQNVVQLLEIYHATQEGCIVFVNMYDDIRKVISVVPVHALLVGKVELISFRHAQL